MSTTDYLTRSGAFKLASRIYKYYKSRGYEVNVYPVRLRDDVWGVQSDISWDMRKVKDTSDVLPL